MVSSSTQVAQNYTVTKAFSLLNKCKERPFDLTAKGALDYDRFSKYVAKSPLWKLYFGCERIDDKVIEAFQEMAAELGLVSMMEAMQRGEIVNEIHGYESEKRPALHTALREIDEKGTLRAPKENRRLVKEQIEKLALFEKELSSFNHLVCIGIGGSELGPKALYVALEGYKKLGKSVHFISNVDPDNVEAELQGLDLAKTLVLVISKTGTTIETLTNEAYVRGHFTKANIDPKTHFISVSQKGSPLDNTTLYRAAFHIWPWVGGRFSASSMISGLIFTFAFGFSLYREFLQGAREMDEIALEPKLDINLPMLGAFFNLWNHNFLGYPTIAIIPYAHALRFWAAHVQQVEMESNGKSIDKEGALLSYKSCPIFWGEPGTNAQHSFFQMIHQGTQIVPIEFIGTKHPQMEGSHESSQKMILANLAAQTIALAEGSPNANPNKRFFGNRPSHILFTEKLTPKSIGALFAYYEHKVVFEGFLLGINSFDQPGVELGKSLATRFLTLMDQHQKGKEVEFKSGVEKYLFELIR